MRPPQFVASVVALCSDLGLCWSAPTKVILRGKKDAQRAAEVLAGRGLNLPGGAATRPVICEQGELVWEAERQIRDAYGYTHTFYRQAFHAIGALAAALPPRYLTFGVPVHGSAIGLHTDGSGALAFAYGHQFENVNLGNTVLLRTPSSAAFAALAAIRAAQSFAALDPAQLTPAQRMAWEDSATLRMAQARTAESLIFEWVVHLPDVDGHLHVAVINAETGDLVDTYDPRAGDVCGPVLTNLAVYGTATPQLPGLGARSSIPATMPTSNSYTSLYTFEAHWPRLEGEYPDINIGHGRDPSLWDVDTTWYCDDQWNRIWGMMPITGSTSPTYQQVTTKPASTGPEAADALWYTHLALQTFTDLGWLGYKGPVEDPDLQSPALAVVHQADTSGYGGYFKFFGDSGGPTDSAVFLPMNSGYENYAPTACLDLVAHEWAHGVEKYSANFGDVRSNDYQNNTLGAQLLEGFADALAHIVEHENNPGNTPGGADWIFGNYCEMRTRPANSWATDPPLCYFKGQTIDGNGCPSYGVGPTYMESHTAGHMLAVAFYLLADGGSSHRNPAYDAGVLGAPSTVVTQKALSIASTVFFDVLTLWATEYTDWEDLPDLAVYAAFAAYNRCPNADANVVQLATKQAFLAINYPLPGGMYTCE